MQKAFDDNIAKAVRAVYSLFSRGFSRPLDSLFFEEFCALQPLLEELLPNERAVIRSIGEYGSQTRGDVLNRHYSSLFMTGAYGKVISPCESVYLSAEGLIMQEQRDEVLCEYVKHKLGRTPLFSEPEDHIAAELAFAAYLADKGSERLNFLTNHILKWIELLEKDLDAFQGGIYKDLASLIRAFAEFDRNILSN